MHTHLAGYVAVDNMSAFQLHSKRGIRQVLKNLTLHLYEIFFRHEAASLAYYRVGIPAPLKLAFFNKLSY